MKKIIHNIVLILFVVCVISCEKENNDNPNKFPTTPEEIAESVKTTYLIADEGGSIIEDAISSAYYSDELIDPNKIAKQIESIEGVESAEATPTGTAIVVKQKDGVYINLLIVTQNDERLFIENSTKSVAFSMKSAFLVNKDPVPVLPNGDGKALILAPFHSSINEDLGQIENLLASAGFDVEIYKNENADLSKFRGDFLNKYDVIFISTHGVGRSETHNGKEKSSILLTGEEYTENSRLPEKYKSEINTIALGSIPGRKNKKVYLAISAQWIRLTTSQNFTNSWVYASACESAMIENGSASLSETFLNLGVAGYNGFKKKINIKLANSIAEKMTARFTSGLSFIDASQEVLNDWGLIRKVWDLRFYEPFNSSISVKLFKYNKKINEPFYLIDPDDVVGVAEVIPKAAIVGTDIIYEVIINEKYVSQVASIEFDIDNTGEHLTMYKINTNTWQRDGLSVPSADSYPRIDTFTFSAFDSGENLIGQGSATFSILEESSAKSTRIKKSNYYEKNYKQ